MNEKRLLIGLLKMSKIKVEDSESIAIILSGYLIAEGDENTIVASRKAEFVDASELEAKLELAGYRQAKRAIKERADEIQVTLLLDDDAWESSAPEVFLSIKEMWESYKSKNDLPESFLVPDALHEEALKFREAFAIYLKVKNLLIKVSDHVTETGSVLLFHTKKDAIRKEEVSLNVNFKDLNELEISSNQNNAIESLLQCVSLEEDAHSHERQNVLKNVVIEELEKKGFKEFFPLLYCSSSCLLSRYREQYKVYVDRFSVNKILNDISEKNLEYNSKVNEFVSSGQTKAFAIPGAIIAVGALVRTGANPWSLVLIIFGLYMIKQFVTSANQVYRESFEHLSSQVSYTFDRFYDLDESSVVHKHASDSKEEVSKRIESAKKRLDNIDFYSKLMFVVGLVFLLINIASGFVCN